MREMGIRACYIKPYVKTTFDSDFSTKSDNILKETFRQASQMRHGVQI